MKRKGRTRKAMDRARKGPMEGRLDWPALINKRIFDPEDVDSENMRKIIEEIDRIIEINRDRPADALIDSFRSPFDWFWNSTVAAALAEIGVQNSQLDRIKDIVREGELIDVPAATMALGFIDDKAMLQLACQTINDNDEIYRPGTIIDGIDHFYVWAANKHDPKVHIPKLLELFSHRNVGPVGKSRIAYNLDLFANAYPGTPETAMIFDAMLPKLKECAGEGELALWDGRFNFAVISDKTQLIQKMITTLGQGDKRAIPTIERFLYLESPFYKEAEEALKNLGVGDTRISELSNRQIDDSSQEGMRDFLNSPSHRAIFDMLERGQMKIKVLDGAETLDALPDRQSWITINRPELAQEAVAMTLEKLGGKRSSLENAIKATLGIRLKEMEEVHYRTYADEILDATVQVMRSPKLSKDDEVQALASKIRYSEGVKLRYIQREIADLSLGDKCGDCTAKGSGNFAKSVTWLANPCYQIIKMSKGKRFIGKVNITLGTLAGEEAIIIDALEFNPQAQKGSPYHEDALECMHEAISFLRDLAERQDRSLFALRTSNSSGAVGMLSEFGTNLRDIRPADWAGNGQDGPEMLDMPITLDEYQRDVENMGGQMDPDAFFDFMEEDVYASEHKKEPRWLSLLIPSEDISRMLSHAGYKGSVDLYYQMLESAGGYKMADASPPGVATKNDIPELEREVVNPAQIQDPKIAEAMRDRDFDRASELILEDPDRAQKVKTICNFPEGLSIGKTFLSKRLKKIFRDVPVNTDSLHKAYKVSESAFVKL